MVTKAAAAPATDQFIEVRETSMVAGELTDPSLLSGINHSLPHFVHVMGMKGHSSHTVYCGFP